VRLIPRDTAFFEMFSDLAKHATTSATLLHDLFADALKTFPQPLVPKLDGRITVLNPPPRRTPE